MATPGGCKFEQLCQLSEWNYACDNTIDIRNVSFQQAKEKLIKHVHDCIRRLETKSTRVITKFYIGKTFVHQKRKPGGGFLTIDPQKCSTYRKDGISSRWSEHRDKHYGRDGMVVLTIVTRHTVPPTPQRLHQEDYTFELEKSLIHHFKVITHDRRIANVSELRGGSDQRSSAAYAVYMAYRMD